ncbi:MAG: VWA domain-containing protein [Actinomycetota bacterium]|nr:VWA domain-containing protein [Actinomycetota bacterium]
MSFLAANRLWLLLGVVALAASYLFMQQRRRGYAVRFTNLSLLSSVAPRRPGWRRHLPAAALLLALVALITAFAQPTRPTRVPRERATIMMAVDVSLSMQATDVKPDRLKAAKAAAANFVDLVPAKLNLGLVAFSGTAQVLVSPTTDRALLKRSIQTLELGPATGIGEAVFACLGAIASVPTAPGQAAAPARIVLMSDGETTVGRSNDVAAAAALRANVPVSTIAFGTEQGTVMVEGTPVYVPVNKEALARLANQTHGSAFTAASGGELKKVYNDIGSSIGYRTSQKDATTWFVGLGLVFAMAAAVGSLVWSSRLP